MQPRQLQDLFEELSGPLVLYARTWCDAPDDAVQEAFIDLANATITPDSPKAWLYKTTRRKAHNIARAEGRRRRYHALATRAASGEVDAWFESSGRAGELVADDVAQALEELSSEERELVTARVWGNLNFEQLADVLGCSVSAAHRRYAAGLAKLKALLNKVDDVKLVKSDKTPS